MEDVSTTIHKNYSGKPALDFAFLRQAGIELIQQLSGKTWTDFNLHDPGVTILESVCYALTDLAYRTNFSIIDLLTNREGIIDNGAHSFIPKKQILSTHPVSPKDFCKWIIDAVEEVDNVWIEPVQSLFADNSIKGFYKPTIRIARAPWNRAAQANGLEGLCETVAGKVKTLLAQSRNIAEEFDEVQVLQPQYLQIEAEIIISKQADPEEVLAQIYYQIEQTLNPQVRFYTEPELLSQGYAVEEIYDGPLLQNGIIPDSELTPIKKTVEVSDLIQALTDMDDVIHIRRFHIKEEGAENYSDKPVFLQPGHYPFLRQQLSSHIRLYHDRLPLPVKLAEFNGMLQRLHDKSNRDFVKAIHHTDAQKHYRDRYTSTEEYSSIQHGFPVTYRLNNQGVESTAPPSRKAQVKQLKAYLLFFEQIMANYLSQLANISNLYSPDLDGGGIHTYFFQPIYTIPGISELLKPFTGGSYKDWSSFIHASDNEFVQSLESLMETDELFITRKNMVFDHLLSRFNITPDKYPVMLYESLYQPLATKARHDAALHWKSGLLQQVADLTKYRAKGMNYLQQEEEDEPGYGFEYNMLQLLYITHKKRRRLAEELPRYLQPAYQPPAGQDSEEEDEYYAESYYSDEEELKIIDDTSLDYATYRIPNRTMRFLEWGTDKKNYRIVPDAAHRQRTFVLYKNPEEPYWNIIKAEASYGAAKKSLRRLISTLRQISIDSEGFHIVEHVLLAPPAVEQVYGFTFRDEGGNPLLREAGWLTHKEREGVIANIIQAAAQAAGTPSKDWISRLQGLCTISHAFKASHTSFVSPEQLLQMDAQEANATAYKVLTALQAYNDPKSFFPRFEFSVLHSEGKILPEGFYDAEVTVVFPSWPLRFQQEAFRRFAQDAFTSYLPVHVKANFLWLDLPKMKQFEDHYFDWLRLLRHADTAERHREATPFIHFLFNELKKT